MESSFINLENFNIDSCRICYDNKNVSTNRLIAPCRCNGSSKYIHDKCLEKWRFSNMPNSDPRKKCMECNYEYNIINIPPKRNIMGELVKFLIKKCLSFLFIFTISKSIKVLTVSKEDSPELPCSSFSLD